MMGQIRRQLTPDALHLRSWKQPWKERVPEELLALGRLYRNAITDLILAKKGPQHQPAIDWEELYRDLPSDVSLRALACIAGSSISLSLPGPKDDEALDSWLRESFRDIKRAMEHPESAPPREVLKAAAFINQSLLEWQNELRATLDHVAALAFFQCPLAVLLQRAEQGDLSALENLLRINPGLEQRSWVKRFMARAVDADGRPAIAKFHTALNEGLDPRHNKLREISSLLFILWPWLGRLTTKQRLAFFTELGVPNARSKEALRDLESRLQLKARYEQWRKDTLPVAVTATRARDVRRRLSATRL